MVKHDVNGIFIFSNLTKYTRVWLESAVTIIKLLVHAVKGITLDYRPDLKMNVVLKPSLFSWKIVLSYLYKGVTPDFRPDFKMNVVLKHSVYNRSLRFFFSQQNETFERIFLVCDAWSYPGMSKFRF